jgi:hypothetical protein
MKNTHRSLRSGKAKVKLPPTNVPDMERIGREPVPGTMKALVFIGVYEANVHPIHRAEELRPKIKQGNRRVP